MRDNLGKLIHNLARNIKELRKKKKMGQSALAGLASISPGTLSRIEAGVLTNTTLETVESLGHALGANPVDLLKSREPLTTPVKEITFYEALSVVQDRFAKLRRGEIDDDVLDEKSLLAYIAEKSAKGE